MAGGAADCDFGNEYLLIVVCFELRNKEKYLLQLLKNSCKYDI
jgi:hypothetical protein